MDVVRDARSRWISLTDASHDPGPVEVVWSPDMTPSCYYFSANTIHVESAQCPDSCWPDTWDKSVILHEYGHFLEDFFGFFRDHPGDRHLWGNRYSLELAASEGCAHFIGAILQDDPVLYNRYGDNLQFWTSSDVETGDKRSHAGCLFSAGNYGYREESSVAGFLWDLWDQSADDRHKWGWSPWTPGTSCQPYPDGIGDNLSLSESVIWTALMERQTGGHHPRTLPEFAEVWRQNPPLGDVRDFYENWYEHGCQCCFGQMGNVDLSLDELVTMGDLTVMIDHLFIDLDPLICLWAGDLNHSGGPYPLVSDISIEDLNLLVDRMFISLIPMEACPDPGWLPSPKSSSELANQ